MLAQKYRHNNTVNFILFTKYLMTKLFQRLFILTIGLTILYLMRFALLKADAYTSNNGYCNNCHIHEHSYDSWVKSNHHLHDSIQAGCVDCHLPPKGKGYYMAKVKTGLHDLHSFYFKDTANIDWEAKSQPDQAQNHVYKSSCIKCHPDLFPKNLSESGEKEHLQYHLNQDKMHCVECHLHTGHAHQINYQKLIESTASTTLTTDYESSFEIKNLNNFTETIPGSKLAFNMIAIEGGKATLKDNSNKETEVSISPFFIGEIEISWNLYLLFLSETEAQGRGENKVDGISGATPPWGNPDQDWGMGSRPAITMTHHAATVFCQWLAIRTGKPYRLPTEAEWEYAAHKALYGKDITPAIANCNKLSTIEPKNIECDAISSKHLFGNVKEFCADSYTENRIIYYSKCKNDPVILENESAEFVIKGGSFKSDIKTLTPAWREATQTKKWLRTDPQVPKSIWWYSDCNDVGFRVALTY